MCTHEFTPLGHRNEAALNQTAAFGPEAVGIYILHVAHCVNYNYKSDD